MNKYRLTSTHQHDRGGSSPRLLCSRSTVFRHYVGYFFAIFISLLLGCGICYADITGKPQPVKDDCSVSSFDDFFKLFSEDVIVQKKSVQIPLEKLEIVDGDPEPKEIIRKLEMKQIAFPVIKNPVQRKAAGLSVRIETPKQNQAIAILFKPDTGYQIRYVFQKKTCWKLIKIENYSL